MGTSRLRRSLLVALTAGVVANPSFLVKAFTSPPTGTGGTAPPRLTINQELSYDFGVARLGDRGSHLWTVRNTGQGDLELWLEKEPACGCTVTSLAKGQRERIPPGGSRDIKLEWRTRKTNDVFAQSATIGTNDPARPRFTLRISGRVYEPVAVSPETVNVFPLYNGETHRSEITIFSSDRPDLAISDIVSSRPDLIAVAMKPLTPDERAKLRAKAGYRIGIEIKPGMPMGTLSETLIVHTNHPDRPTLDIRITGVVTGPIVPAPSRLSIPIGEAQESLSRDVMLLVHDGRETHFEVMHKPSAVGVSIVPAAASAGKRRYRLAVTTLAKAKAERETDFIVVKTDHPKARVVRIPVHFTSVVTNPISAAPSRLSIPIGEAQESLSRDVMLLVHDGRETHFEVMHKPSAVGVSIVPAAASAGKRRYRLTVTALAKAKAERETDFIVVKTDHPKARVVTIPIDFDTRRADGPTAKSAANTTEAAR
jgi:hypothetical protein